MRVKILLPTSIFLEQEVRKIVAEGMGGSFCLSPRHIDYTNALAPGIVTLESGDDQVAYSQLQSRWHLRKPLNTWISSAAMDAWCHLESKLELLRCE